MQMPRWVLVPEPWATKLVDLPETSMGVQIVNVTLQDGKVQENFVVCGGMFDENNTPFLWAEVSGIEASTKKDSRVNFTDIDDTWVV